MRNIQQFGKLLRVDTICDTHCNSIISIDMIHFIEGTNNTVGENILFIDKLIYNLNFKIKLFSIYLTVICG